MEYISSILDGEEPVQQPNSTDYQPGFITYKYYVKHQRYAAKSLLSTNFLRLVSDVPISAMSPVPIACRIKDTLDVQMDQQIAEQQTGEFD